MSHSPEHTPVHHEQIDPWHMHTADEGTPQVEHAAKANPWILIGFFVGSVGFLVVFCLATIVYANGYLAARRAAKVEITASADVARSEKATAEMRLSDYGWVDAGQGRVRIPIRAAMEEMAAQSAAPDGTR